MLALNLVFVCAVADTRLVFAAMLTLAHNYNRPTLAPRAESFRSMKLSVVEDHPSLDPLLICATRTRGACVLNVVYVDE